MSYRHFRPQNRSGFTIPNRFGDAGFLGFSFGCIAVLCSTPVAGSTEGEQRADKTNKDVDSENGRFRSVGYIAKSVRVHMEMRFFEGEIARFYSAVAVPFEMIRKGLFGNSPSSDYLGVEMVLESSCALMYASPTLLQILSYTTFSFK